MENPKLKPILNADDLLEAIMDSLSKLENKLQGETPNAIFLWNKYPESKEDRSTEYKHTPKDENDFSDFIKTHLTEDLKNRGVIAQREVEIRRGQGDNKGERTDIYESFYIQSKEVLVKVIIEVKGCWHIEVETAMKTQLLDRYLNENDCNHGIYLVGWYSCKQWTENNSKKNRIKAKNISEARSQFDNQAKGLSTGNKKIKACVLNCALR